MEDKKATNWQRIVIYLAGVQFITILVLLYIAFGFAVTYGLVFFLLVAWAVAATFAAIRQTRNIRAAEAGLQYVFDRVNGLGLEIDSQIKDMVWAEDVPEIRRISQLMKDARQELLNAPLLFNGTVVEEIYDPVPEEIENEEQLRDILKGQLNESAIEMLAGEISSLRKE